MVEKADAETGWVYPVPEETRAYGYSQQMRHFIDHFARGRPTPAETFEDGYIVNRIIDACYRSMKSGHWEPIEIDPAARSGWARGGADDSRSRRLRASTWRSA